MGLQELLKNPLIAIMKMNAESLSMKIAHGLLQPAFFRPFFLSYQKDGSFYLSLRPKDYHVFSFTAIRALLVIMQMRKHAGNLIRTQI